MGKTKCDDCQTGLEMYQIHKDFKEKKITKKEFIRKIMPYGGVCIECIHNPTGKLKTKIYKAVHPTTKSYDAFIPKKVEECTAQTVEKAEFPE